MFYRHCQAAWSGDNLENAWQAWGIVRVSFSVARTAFGEDPSCVERGRRCIWDTFVIAAFRIGATARGATLSVSFVPFCVARAVLGDVAACHSRLGAPHYLPHFQLLH